jgi:preprotein translocase subunit SecD
VIRGGRHAPASRARAVAAGFDKYSNQYDLTGGGADNTLTLTMKPSGDGAEQKTVQQAIETITRPRGLAGRERAGDSPYGLGKYQILVELPGISDLDRGEEHHQSTARLEIHAVVGGPYKDEQEALASVNGALPPDEMMLHGSGNLARARMRTRVCAASAFRWSRQRLPLRRSGHGPERPRDVHFTLTNEAGDKFYDYTSKNVNTSMAVVMGGRVKEVANIQSAIRDSGRDCGQLLAPPKLTCCRRCCARARCRPR